jgi:hypothetical protein
MRRAHVPARAARSHGATRLPPDTIGVDGGNTKPERCGAMPRLLWSIKGRLSWGIEEVVAPDSTEAFPLLCRRDDPPPMDRLASPSASQLWL